MVYDGITPLDSLYDSAVLYWRRLLRQTDPVKWLHAELDGNDRRNFFPGSPPHFDLIDPEAQSLFHHFEEFDFLQQFVQSTQRRAEGPVSLVDLFWLEEFQQRFFACGPQILRTTVEVRCPFFDKKMLALIGTLAPIHRSSDKPLQRRTIQALTPALARIPWERTGLPLAAGRFKTHARRAGRILRRKIDGMIERTFHPVPGRSNAGKMADYNEMLRTSPELQQRLITPLIDDWTNGSRLFNRENLQALLAQHLSRAGNHAEIIGRILTVEIWHKLFVRNATARQDRGHAQIHERALRLAA